MNIIEINEDEITAALERLASAMTNMMPVMQDLGEFLATSTRDRFTEGTGPDGTPWAPKSPATLDAYARRRDPVDDRPLFGPTRRLSSEIHWFATPDSVEWGSSHIYAATQQFGAAQGAFGATSRGSPIPWGGIPARPFLGLSDSDRAEIADIVAEWLEGIAAGG